MEIERPGAPRTGAPSDTPVVRLAKAGAPTPAFGRAASAPREPGWRSWAWATLALLVAGVAIGFVISDAQSPILRWFQDLRTPTLVDLEGLRRPVRPARDLDHPRRRPRHRRALQAMAAPGHDPRPVRRGRLPGHDPRRPAPRSGGRDRPVDQRHDGVPLVPRGRAVRDAVRSGDGAGPGRPASQARPGGAFAVMGLVVLARLLLGADYPLDAAYSLLLGWIIVGSRSRSSYPKTSSRLLRAGRAAHLDLGGARGEAIVAAVRDQLGSR